MTNKTLQIRAYSGQNLLEVDKTNIPLFEYELENQLEKIRKEYIIKIADKYKIHKSKIEIFVDYQIKYSQS